MITGGLFSEIRLDYITEFVMCSWHKQLPHVIGVGPQWATTYGNYSRLRNRTEGLELELGLTDIQTGATTALFE